MRARSWAIAAAATAAAAVAVPAPAAAGTLWEGKDGSPAVEGRAFYKALGSGVRLSRGMVDAAAELQRAFDEARAMLPPDQQGSIPPGEAVPDAGGSTGHVVRLEGKVTWTDLLTLEAAYQAGALVASSPAFAGGAGVPGAFAAASGEGPARRFVDLPGTLFSRPGLRMDQNLDRLSVRLALKRADVVVGRQVLSWGTGRFWNPTDLLSPFSPVEIDREVRRGIDAVRVSVPLSSTSQLEALWLPRRVAAENGGALRAQVNLMGYDVSLSVAKYVSDLVAGADFTGDLGPLGVHGEAAYTWGLTGLGESGASVGVGERALRAVVGLDWRPSEKLVLTGEYSFNGFGARDASGYLAALTSPRARRGEIFGAGRHYAGLAASYAFTDLLSLQLVALANLQDPSAQLVPVVEYWFEQSVILRAGAFIPLGRAPDPGALRGLTGADVLGQTQAFRDATASFGLQSEYGVSSFGVLAQVGVYFQ